MEDPGLVPDEHEARPIYTSRRRERRWRTRSRVTKTLAVLGAVVVLGGAGWLWYHYRSGAGAPASDVMAPTASTTAAGSSASSATAADATPLPALDSSDAFVRPLVKGLSSHPQLASWMASDELIHRFVLSVVDVALGRSPRQPLRFLAPKRSFTVKDTKGALTLDPAGYHRYDAATTTFVSLDTQGTAELYRRLLPLMDTAYADLGLKDVPFQQMVARAFGRLLAVPVLDAPPTLAHHTVAYEFADPALEALSPAEKHLLRVGPENERRIQAKLRELAAAMGVEPQAPAPDAGG